MQRRRQYQKQLNRGWIYKMAALDYFYDGQLRGYLVQAVRAFHGFQYASLDRNGNSILRQIPVSYGDRSRLVAHILNNNSENVMNSTPFISVYISELQMRPQDRQAPAHEEHVRVREREFDEEAQAYTQNSGNAYSMYRFMPVPYLMSINVDIWTTNNEQKLQILEQLLVLYNPTLDIQSNTNPLDWTAKTYLEMVGLTWSSRSIPSGTDNQIDIATININIPIWLNPPAKVQKQNVIQQIVQNIVELNVDCFGETGFLPSDADLLSQQIVTPGNYFIQIDGTEITLLGEGGGPTDVTWPQLFDIYGNFRPGVTELRLKRYAENLDDLTNDIFGPIEIHPTNDSILLWAPDPLSIPSNTLPAIDAIIDPHISFPGNGLPVVNSGQRYLITQGIADEIGGDGGDTFAWGSLVAHVNDIIEFDGTEWTVAFEAATIVDKQFAVNLFAGQQLLFDNNEWVLAVDGEYSPGYWRLNFC